MTPSEQGKQAALQLLTWSANPYSRVKDFESYCDWLRGFKKGLELQREIYQLVLAFKQEQLEQERS